MPKINLNNPILLTAAFRQMPLHAEYKTEENGHVSGIVPELEVMDSGEDYEQCLNLLLEGCKEYAGLYLEDLNFWYSGRPDDLIYILKVLTSSNEELKECLSGQV